MKLPYETHEYDVLVIGAGGAGLRAAVEASESGVRTGLVCKSLLGKAHTVMAEGGMAAALANVDTRDNWQVHFRDTMRGGKFLNHWRMAQLHAQEAPERVRELETWGAVFDRTPDGKILQRNFGGHKYPRLAHVGDRTGLEMIRTLQDRTVEKKINVHMECTIYRLLKDGDAIAGAVGYWRESGRPIVFRAKCVVLATGGIGRCFRVTSNSWEYTGDGHALGYLAGADLIDMEFMQFHPTGMVWPPSVRGILVTEGVRGEGGVLRNSKGERFMFSEIPDMFKADTAADEAEADRWLKKVEGARRPPELLTRDVVARAIVRQVKEGRGSPHGGAFLDIASRRSADDIKKKLPSMYHQFKELGGIDITKEPMEVGPTAHYIMGGVRVDPESQMSSVPGLFAAGEVAGGLHGANRLGGNSLSDLLVFGRRAGLGASKFAQSTAKLPAVDEQQIESVIKEMYEPFDRPQNENAFTITYDLQTTMEANVGIARIEHELVKAMEDLAKLKERAKHAAVVGDCRYNPGWHQVLDLNNLLICAEALTRAALTRRESRGAHMRIDYQATDAQEGKWNNILRRGTSGEMVLEKSPLPELPDELKTLVLDEKKA